MLEPDEGVFRLSDVEFPFSLNPGTSKNVKVSFVPDRRGSMISELSMLATELDEDVKVVLTGVSIVTSVEDASLVSGFNIYPLPASESVTIRFELRTPSDYSLYFYNLNGQLVKEFTGFASFGSEELTWQNSRSINQESGVFKAVLISNGKSQSFDIILSK